MQLQEQLDDIFRPPRDAPGTSRKRNFGAKPKLWDTRIRPEGLQNTPVDDLVDIKVRRITRCLLPLLLKHLLNLYCRPATLRCLCSTRVKTG